VAVGDEKSRKNNATDELSAVRERAEHLIDDATGGKPRYEEGFTGRVVAGAIFILLFMMPGSIYLGLVAGQDLGGAAQWVTVVLFSEIARRSFMPLKRQEIYCLFYLAGALAGSGWGSLPGISGGPFGGWIGVQYLMQTPALAPIAANLPHWIGPHAGSTAYQHRSFLDPAWYQPIFWSPVTVLLFTQIFDRIKWICMGYALFRMTSDVERLPFPMAPIAVSGVTALADSSNPDESWRWRVFSACTVIGLVFGAFYVFLPVVTGATLAKPVSIFPIPFFDLTSTFERVLPAAVIGYNPNLGQVLLGFLLPFHIVAGIFTTSILTEVIVNPYLQTHGMLPHWLPGSQALDTNVEAGYDYWTSFGIGVQLFVALAGFATLIGITIRARKNKGEANRAGWGAPPPGRGDFPLPLAIAGYFLAATGFVILNHQLVPMFPVLIIAFYALIWTPILSYVSARLYGLAGQSVDIPFMNQLIVMKSGYTSPDIWFAPLPLNNYGGQAQKFRELELLGVKFTSILKLEAFLLPVVLIASFCYWGFIWYTSEIPSAQFPYVQKFWPQWAVQSSIWWQINAAGADNWAIKAIKPDIVGVGSGCAAVVYAAMLIFKWPILFYYGLVGGVANLPHNTIPLFLGGVLGRYVFQKKFGVQQWQSITPILMAGFACGMGLVSMCAIALALISKTVSFLPF
jgi:hypothetical protein